jgi:DNA (cytosine-5)-methyltransferase 1
VPFFQRGSQGVNDLRSPRTTPKKRPTALGAYIFAGGQTVGVEKAGFEVLAHFEDGKYGVATFQKNRPNIPVFTDPAKWPIEEYRGKVDWVYCNPPCAVFSNAGKSHGSLNGWRTDPRLGCYRRCFALLESLQPHVLTIESVTNAYRNGREFLQELEVEAAALGYSTTHLFIDGQYCGLPQSRRRHFSTFTRARFHAIAPDFATRVNVSDILKDIHEPGFHRAIKPELASIYARLKPRQGVAEAWMEDHPKETWEVINGRVKGRPRMMEARVPWNDVMGAFIGDFYIHPLEARPLGVNEARALCMYPEDWILGCPPASAFSEFARSVLPPVAEWVGKQVLATFERAPLNQPVHDLFDFTTPHSLLGEGTHADV